MILMGMVKSSQSFEKSKFALTLEYLKKEVRDIVNFCCMKLIFLHTVKHQSFLDVDFNTLGIKVSDKMIVTLLMDMVKHSQSTGSNKFAISLQYVKKEAKDGVHFSHADKHQSFYKLVLSLLI